MARCPSCKRYYCRECVTEHEGRVICAACLAALDYGRTASVARLYHFRSLGRGILALLVLWFVFFALGRALVAVPHEFHEGALWNAF